jgi:hypothetical protein
MALREDLVNVLRRVHFDLPIEVIVDVMDSDQIFSTFLGYQVSAYTRYVHSINIDDLRDDFATEIGMDVLRMHTTKNGSKYAIYFHEVPSKGNNFLVSYGKASA